MKPGRYFTLSIDIPHNTKIGLLKDLEGGEVAFGRWVHLMCILYDSNGIYDITSKFKRRFLEKELELSNDDDLRGFLQSCAECELLSAELLEMGHVVSPAISEQIDFHNKKAEAGKSGSDKRWSKGTRKKATEGTS